MNRRRFLQLSSLVMLALLLLVLMAAGSSAAAGPEGGQGGLQEAIAVQESHADALLAHSGVVGVAVGQHAGAQPTIWVYVISEGVTGLPVDLEGIPVETVVTGMFFAFDPTDRYRPAPIGVSVGHPDITAGTIGARVKDNQGNVYVLSNNHVLANSNDSDVGDSALQPGPFDGGTDPADKIGTLHAFEPIKFDGSNNTMDAAIAKSTTAELGNSTLPEGYGVPGTTVVSASIGLGVQKCGRTTGCTTGQVAEINATVDVCYESSGIFCTKVARFVNQFTISPGSFSAGGDSGSLIVTNNSNKNPVGLLFAGSATRTIANPIGPVLNHFGVTIDGSTGPGPTPTPIPTSTPDPGPGDFTLTATGYEVRGRQKVDLEWSGATSTKVEIYRNGSKIATTANDGFHTDNVNQSGSYTYKVCETRSNTCSNEAQVDF